MLSVSVIVTEEVKVPPPGLSAGVAARMVYVAVATELLAVPGFAPIALIVVVCVTVIGPVYAAYDVVGVLPSVV